MKAIRSDPATRVEHLRSVLRSRLRAVQKRNARFSLRAFAKQLGVDHSTLSQLLRGKRPLTSGRAEMFAQRLGLAADLVKEHALAAEQERRGAGRRMKSRTFDADTFAFVSQWPHSAILELTHLARFRADSRWIADALGLDVADVNVIVQRLLRLRLLEMAARDKWVDKSRDVELVGARLDEATKRRLAAQSHGLAVQAAERRPLNRQRHAQMILAADRSQLPALQQLVERFMSDARALTARGTPDEVYHVTVAIHPMTGDR